MKEHIIEAIENLNSYGGLIKERQVEFTERIINSTTWEGSKNVELAIHLKKEPSVIYYLQAGSYSPQHFEKGKKDLYTKLLANIIGGSIEHSREIKRLFKSYQK